MTAQSITTSQVPADPRRWAAFAILLIAGFMDILDGTIVFVALPSMAADLGASFETMEWVIAGYTLAFALTLITGGRLGDIYGRKRVFLVGVMGFVVASVVAGIQCQEAVKRLHGLDTLRGAGFVFDGLAHESYRVSYTRSPSCGAHEAFAEVRPLAGGAATTTVDEALAGARALLGPEAVVELPGDLVTAFRCAPCGRERKALRRDPMAAFAKPLAPACSAERCRWRTGAGWPPNWA